MKNKNASGPIRIHLDGSLRYLPGEHITGTVEIDPDHLIRCQGVEVRLMWYTEGKGRRNEGVIESLRYDVNAIDPQRGFHEVYSFTLPSAPWSYAGHFINIVWVIHVKVDIPMAPDINHELRFLVLPEDIAAS